MGSRESYRAVNMSKSCSFAVVLAVICLSIILLSLETDAQPTVDETMTCHSSSPSMEVADMFKTIASHQHENAKAIKDVQTLLTSNPLECYAVEPSKQTLVSALLSNCVPLLIQQKADGSDFFNRSWAEFKVGFNDSSGNYWLGNELLSQLTLNGPYKLKFDLQSRSNYNWYYAEYSTFIVLSERSNFTLHVAGYSGNAGSDALSNQNGMMFTTYDHDNDHNAANCALSSGGGFWYNNCAYCAVNAARGGGQDFMWRSMSGGSGLKSSRMWLQCK